MIHTPISVSQRAPIDAKKPSAAPFAGSGFKKYKRYGNCAYKLCKKATIDGFRYGGQLSGTSAKVRTTDPRQSRASSGSAPTSSRTLRTALMSSTRHSLGGTLSGRRVIVRPATRAPTHEPSTEEHLPCVLGQPSLTPSAQANASASMRASSGSETSKDLTPLRYSARQRDRSLGAVLLGLRGL